MASILFLNQAKKERNLDRETVPNRYFWKKPAASSAYIAEMRWLFTDHPASAGESYRFQLHPLRALSEALLAHLSPPSFIGTYGSDR
jgi:hypothetical protein